MRDCVQQDVADGRERGFRALDLPPAAPSDVCREGSTVALSMLAAPVLDRLLAKLEEDALAVHLCGGEVGGCAPSKRDTAFFASLVEGRFNAGEAE